MSTENVVVIAGAGDGEVGYERPILLPMGNLHDLLLGASGVLCDSLTSAFDNLTQTGMVDPGEGICGP